MDNKYAFFAIIILILMVLAVGILSFLRPERETIFIETFNKMREGCTYENMYVTGFAGDGTPLCTVDRTGGGSAAIGIKTCSDCDNIFLNLSGTNANQNIDFSPYNLTTGRVHINMSGVTPAISGDTGLIIQKSALGESVAMSLLSYKPGDCTINFGNNEEEVSGYILYANGVMGTEFMLVHLPLKEFYFTNAGLGIGTGIVDEAFHIYGTYPSLKIEDASEGDCGLVGVSKSPSIFALLGKTDYLGIAGKEGIQFGTIATVFMEMDNAGNFDFKAGNLNTTGIIQATDIFIIDDLIIGDDFTFGGIATGDGSGLTGLAGGSNFELQWNDNGELAGDSGFKFGTDAGYLALDGDEDWVNIPNHASLDITDALTLSAWVWFDADTPNPLVASYGSSWIMVYCGLSDFGFSVSTVADGWVHSKYSPPPSTDAWHHVVGTFDGRYIKTYVDHILKKTTDLGEGGNTLNPSGYDLIIGRYSNRYLKGRVDELMIFDTAIDSTEVGEIEALGRNAGSYAGTSVGNLISHWRFDDNTADDDVGSNDGTFEGDAHIVASPSFIVSTFDIKMQGDNQKLFFGAGDNSSIYYNASDMIINPKEVGSGKLYVLGDLDATGNCTCENVFLPAYIRTASNSTIPVTIADVWYNITFQKKEEDLKENIQHTWNDATNDTITINDAGVYNINLECNIEDADNSPDAILGFRLWSVTNEAIVKGSFAHGSTYNRKKDEELYQDDSFITRFEAGEQIKAQFTADKTTIKLIPCAENFHDSPFSAQLNIHKVSNS